MHSLRKLLFSHHTSRFLVQIIHTNKQFAKNQITLTAK
jgi:hypothetical protein